MVKGLMTTLCSNRQNSIVWITGLGHAYTHWFPATFYLLLPIIKDTFGLSYSQMGFLITVRYVVGAFANIPSGILVDLVGRRNLIMAIALIWVSFPYFLVGVSSSYAILILCMAIIGAGNNLWHSAALLTLRDYCSQERGWAIGWHAAAANIGDALGPFASGIFLAWFSWRYILVGSVLPGLLLALLIWWMIEDATRSCDSNYYSAGEVSTDINEAQEEVLPTKSYLKGLGKLLLNRNILLLCLTAGIRTLTQNGLLTFLPSYFINLLHLSPWLSGTYMTLIQVAGVIAAPISGRLSDWTGRKRVVTAGLSLTSLAIFLLAFINIPWLFITFLGVMGFFLYSLRPVFIAWTMELSPREYGGSAAGIQFSFQSAFSALAPVLGGWIADMYGLMYTFYFLAATVLLSNLLVVFIPDPGGSTATPGN